MKLFEILIGFVVINVSLLCEAANSSYLNGFINRQQQKLIEGSMDLEADPCEDFYQYACGNWAQYVEGAGSQFIETLSMIDYKVNREFSQYMKSIRLWNSPRFVRKAYEYYRSCIDVELYRPENYLYWLERNENMKWPILLASAATLEDHYDWVYSLATLRRYGLNGILIEQISFQKKEDYSKMVIDLDKPIEDGPLVPLTARNLKEIFAILDIQMNKTAFRQLSREIHKLENRLLQLDNIPDEVGTQWITMQDLPLTWLRRYLQIVLNQTALDSHLEIRIQNIAYMKALDALLLEYDNGFICKYLQIRFLWYMRSRRPPIFMTEGCIISTRGLMPLAMHWIYEQQKPQIEEETPKIQQFFSNIKNHFKAILEANGNEFNRTVLQYLLAKLNHTQLKVGNLPRVDTIQVLETHYEDLKLNVSDFYGNHLQLIAFNLRAQQNSFKTVVPTNATQFFHLENYETGSSLSPYFIQRSNMVVLPSTLVQRPVYHAGYKDIYKYSAIGFLLAHEMLHGFDDTGLEVDINGSINTQQYQNILRHSKFSSNYRCLRDLDPSVTNEKIADLSGLRIAYDSFFSTHPNDVSETRMIYGKQISMQELFFLNFAQFFCGSSTSKYYVSITEHGKDTDRVNDAVANFPEFSRAFGCSPENRMQPKEACKLWRR